MEGPAFSTRAESRLHRSWGADVIGMTALPEAKLAREAEICYSVIACVTDYDSWHETIAPVSMDTVLAVMQRNMTMARQIIKLAVARLSGTRSCDCASALANAITTDPKTIPPEIKQKLKPIIGKYIK